ncbi:response regulator [uncultured Dokdonia sp.]|uniref:response regulator n=1 Tax=uncultured Dokdonia sp. TaxID=575653 RepID=UPI00262C5CC0|nr:response regulator [uncultured Dokdonia sp.]
MACIIDDDDMYVNLITKVLDMKNLVKNLLIFKNGKEALDYFVGALKKLEERKIPQVILLDLNMPVMNGWQFLNNLSEYDFPELKNSTLYIVSSSINPVDIERSKTINLVTDFLIKPVTMDQLSEIFMDQSA